MILELQVIALLRDMWAAHPPGLTYAALQVFIGQHVFLRYMYNQAEFACGALVVDHVAGFRFYCF